MAPKRKTEGWYLEQPRAKVKVHYFRNLESACGGFVLLNHPGKVAARYGQMYVDELPIDRCCKKCLKALNAEVAKEADQ